CDLKMDVYLPSDGAALHPCIIYIYGGGFILNGQKENYVTGFCRRAASDGFVAVAPDYRLGLKGKTTAGVVGMVKPLEDAVHMAVEDVYSAVKYILDNAEELKVDTSKIILAGTSAGAITALQMDYELANNTEFVAYMPYGFRFAGVVSCSGAIFSRKGAPTYTKQAPAPTFFLHGTKDRLVTYDKIQFFNIGFFGSNVVSKQFRQAGYPYVFYRYEGRSHEVSAFNIVEYDAIMEFINDYALGNKRYMIEKTITELDMDSKSVLNWSTNDLMTVDKK
ncbi:MAG: alpha/beta hydrolase, partial [Bacteroidales bacterium]|nr:alpha/beta hydrolase [Bacteroidales bacterium]